MFAVCPGKGGIIVKTTGITGGGDGFPLGDLISCQQKALRGQIVSDRITGFFLEGIRITLAPYVLPRLLARIC